ncbi:hypothetical protein TCAL_01221 [Tigriopus californicus]|uniref:C2H2-type domain-containing protein n=1 Tax=Tigriopus californicus TaxID=6832 RepID=A0A553NXK4_TIGCA|nr:hypothetical protein TCAL_01221 [Tigriopus californicus]
MESNSEKTLEISKLSIPKSLQILDFDPWQVIARRSVDWYKHAQTPNIALMIFVNAQTHVYTLNVLHRTYEEGRIKDTDHLDEIIQRFFDGSCPCYGFRPNMASSLQFVEDCRRVGYLACESSDNEVKEEDNAQEPPDNTIVAESDPEYEVKRKDESTVLAQRSSRRVRKKAAVMYDSFLEDPDDPKDLSDVKASSKVLERKEDDTEDEEFVPDRSDSEGDETEDRRSRNIYLPRGYEVLSLSENESRIPCPHCNMLLKTASSLRSHLRFHGFHKVVKAQTKASKLPKLSCSHCDAEFRHPKAMTKHLKNKHGVESEDIQHIREKNQCWICSQIFKNRNLLQVHKKEEHLLGDWQCLFCHETPRHGQEVMDHYESNHRKSNFKIFCVICSKKICFSEGFQVLQDHWKVCYHKRKKEKTAIYKERQQKTVKDTKVQHVCDLCGKILRSKKILQEHQNEHRGIFKYQCPDCNYKSAFRLKFKYHRTHKHLSEGTKISDYVPCEYCGKIVNSGSLHSHIARYHCQPTLPCDQCDKLFSSQGLLNGHKNTVHGEKIPVKCQVCGLVLKSKFSLRGHMATHAPPKFTCRFCGKGLKTRLSLGNHERIHTKENPYKCDQCSFACATGGNLLLHKKRKHDLQKKFFHSRFQLPEEAKKENL